MSSCFGLDSVGSSEHAAKHIVVIHGAGSFGHFQAKQYKVSKGWHTCDVDKPQAKRQKASGEGPDTEENEGLDAKQTRDMSVYKGFALTRASVCKLNLLVCGALLEKVLIE